MKKIVFVFMFLILVSFVSASKVYIFNFGYEDGLISLKDQIVKEGYYPDRKVSVSEGYKCALVDDNLKELYSFKFELPNKLYVDGAVRGKMIGNVIVLSKTDFSFVMPYFGNAGKLVCYNPAGYKILDSLVVREQLSPLVKSGWLWWYVGFGVVGFVFLVVYYNRKRFK